MNLDFLSMSILMYEWKNIKVDDNTRKMERYQWFLQVNDTYKLFRVLGYKGSVIKRFVSRNIFIISIIECKTITYCMTRARRENNYFNIKNCFAFKSTILNVFMPRKLLTDITR